VNRFPVHKFARIAPTHKHEGSTDRVWNGAQRRVIEVTFAFGLLARVDQYTISFAVHSRDDSPYDWLDAALFVRVTSQALTGSIANLHAGAVCVAAARTPSLRTRACRPLLRSERTTEAGVGPRFERASRGELWLTEVEIILR